MRSESTAAASYIRVFERFVVSLRAHAIQDGLEIPCTVRDVSAGGARVEIDPIARSARRARSFVLTIDGLGSYPCEQRWLDRQALGVEFMTSPSVRAALGNQLAARYAVAAFSSAD